jgi:hypothetical protein
MLLSLSSYGRWFLFVVRILKITVLQPACRWWRTSGLSCLYQAFFLKKWTMPWKHALLSLRKSKILKPFGYKYKILHRAHNETLYKYIWSDALLIAANVHPSPWDEIILSKKLWLSHSTSTSAAHTFMLCAFIGINQVARWKSYQQNVCAVKGTKSVTSMLISPLRLVRRQTALFFGFKIAFILFSICVVIFIFILTLGRVDIYNFSIYFTLCFSKSWILNIYFFSFP